MSASYRALYLSAARPTVLAPRLLISTTLITVGPLSPRGVALLLFLLRPSDCRAHLPFFLHGSSGRLLEQGGHA
jgi:hypothetical protein